jgi:hypothetical protein
MPREDVMTDEERATPRWQIVYAAATCGVIGYCLAYLLCDAFKWPRLAYEPYRGEVVVVGRPMSPSTMTYVGTVLWGVVGGALGAAVGATIARARRRVMSARTVSLLGAWAITAFALAGVYYLWNLWPF